MEGRSCGQAIKCHNLREERGSVEREFQLEDEQLEL